MGNGVVGTHSKPTAHYSSLKHERLELDRAAEAVDLARLPPPPLPAPQLPDVEPGVLHAVQLLDLVTERLHHPPDLPVPAFVEREADLTRVVSHVGRAVSGGGAVFERDAGAETV